MPPSPVLEEVEDIWVDNDYETVRDPLNGCSENSPAKITEHTDGFTSESANYLPSPVLEEVEDVWSDGDQIPTEEDSSVNLRHSMEELLKESSKEETDYNTSSQ